MSARFSGYARIYPPNVEHDEAVAWWCGVEFGYCRTTRDARHRIEAASARQHEARRTAQRFVADLPDVRIREDGEFDPIVKQAF